MNTAKNRPEPEPDILCSLCSGEKVAFELVQAEDVTTYTNAEGGVTVKSIQEKESRPGVHSSAVSPSIVDKVEKKLKKLREGAYQSDHPIHFLVWSDTASIRERPFWRDKLETLLTDDTGSSFERIWVYGRTEKAIVFDSAQRV